jgi:hypothetical protein
MGGEVLTIATGFGTSKYCDARNPLSNEQGMCHALIAEATGFSMA